MNDISYNNWSSMSDVAILKKIGSFIRHHRLEQNKSQNILATNAGISRSTLSLLERGETVTLSTLIQVLRTLDQLQVLEIFVVNEVVSPILLAKMEQKKRRRASGNSEENNYE